MTKFKFTKTDDGSLGLFDLEVNDIYHAKQGAFTEACEKFSLPAIAHLKQTNEQFVKLTDICFGIGYNTISFINLLLKEEKLFNQIKKININIFEINKELIILSSFVKSNKYHWLIRLKLLNSIKKYISNREIDEICLQHKDFIDTAIYKRFKGQLKFTKYISNINIKKHLFLHNTYYNYISTRYNITFNINNIKKIHFYCCIGNARILISDINSEQNIVFLDAFDPKKLPTLWTKEFFEQIYYKLSINGKLFTYSHAASIRAGMKLAKFFVGKNQFGTECSKDKKYLTENLSDYETGLLNTNAGIPYRDYNNFKMSSSEIIQDRLRRMKLENRESSTHYAKKFGK